jgi:hypothetical protein
MTNLVGQKSVNGRSRQLGLLKLSARFLEDTRSSTQNA